VFAFFEGEIMAFVMPLFAALGTAAGASAATAGIAGLSLASGALGVVGAIQQGQQANAAAQSEANMAEYNAKMAEIQTRQAYAAAGVQEDETRRRGRAAVGLQLASSAEAGAGLNGDLLRESIYGIEGDSMAIRYESDLKAQGLKDTAALQRSSADVSRDRGRRAVSASYLNAGTSLLGSATSYYGATSRIASAGKVTS
jgi:hypothetical protein